MDESFPIAAWFVATRAVHFAACLVLFGVLTFDRGVVVAVLRQVGPDRQAGCEANRLWRIIANRLILVALPIALLSGASWLALVAINMSGLPVAQALRVDNLSTIWDRTQFGTVWKLRLLLWVATTLSAALYMRAESRVGRPAFAWIALLLSGMLAGSLACSGHGRTGPWIGWHLLADTCHLLAAGCWGAGLLPFTMMLIALRRAPSAGNWPVIGALVSRFSAISVVSVAIVALSGLVNSWILVGSVSNLASTLYGRVLLLKIALFCIAVGIACINRLSLKPRLLNSVDVGRSDTGESAAVRLQINALAELALVTIVLTATAFLGLLMPSAR